MKRILSLILALTLALGLALPALGAEARTFTDVSADADYAWAVAWCVEKGLMNGVGDDRFDPDGSTTRSMLATVLYRQAGEPSLENEILGYPFADVDANAWYGNAVYWARLKGVLRGYGNDLFGVNDPVSKEMLNVVMARQKGEDPTWTGDAALAVPAKRSEAAVALYETFGEEKTTPSGGGKVLVAYYSATGSTERVANYIAEDLNADTFELTPVDAYTSADLNWTESSSRVNAEHNDEAKRDIQLVNTTPDNWDDYDVVFVGYPIWWGVAAWPVNRFVTGNDFTDKTVIPFCTSASSGLGQSGTLLAEMASEGDWRTGQRFQSGVSQSTVTTWVKTLDI